MVSGNFKTSDSLYLALQTNQTKQASNSSAKFSQVMNESTKQTNAKNLSNTQKNTGKVDNKKDANVSNIDVNKNTSKDVNKEVSKFEDTSKDIKKFDDAMNKLKEEMKTSKEAISAVSAMMQNLSLVDVSNELSSLDIESTIEAISSTLNISSNELMSYLENNNLDLSSLNDPKNVMNLVLDIKGIEDPSKLLIDSSLNEEVSKLVASINETIKDLSKNFTQTTIEDNVLLGNTTLNEKDANSKTSNTQTENDAVTVNGEDIQSKISEMSKSETKQNNDSSHQDTTDKQAMFGNTQMPQGTATQIVEGLANAIAGTSNDMSQAEIISQVIEQVKTQFKPDMTSMEMQLYPEHLGKVAISVVAKDGAITAQIAAETESAKVAMESQLSTLKDALNNQGIKVDAVEVTVANHGFDENLSNGENGSKENEQKSYRVRKSLLDGINDDEMISFEDISETAQMETIGNTVSYKA